MYCRSFCIKIVSLVILLETYIVGIFYIKYITSISTIKMYVYAFIVFGFVWAGWVHYLPISGAITVANTTGQGGLQIDSS